MKKVLLLGALLSTMAFGATVDSGELPAVTKEITLSGTAIPQVRIEEIAPVAFGVVVEGASVTKPATINITGSDAYGVKLTAEIKNNTSSLISAEFQNGTELEKSVVMSGGTGQAILNITYKASGNLTKESITVTAKYE